MICRTTYKCVECGKPVDEDDAVYVNKQGYATTTYGDPYHTYCAPSDVCECKNCGVEISDWERHLVPIINREGEFVKFVCKECGNDPTIQIVPKNKKGK